MKTIHFALIAILAMLFIPEIGNAETESSPVGQESYAMFYARLQPYGDWFEYQPGMMVWHPRFAQHHWRPYTEGRWVWTDYGWYWVSDEPFGWAVFHYGRWMYDARIGWLWVPDRVWGPAWVDWRYNDDYIGWSPLPPSAVFHISFGIRFTRPWAAPIDSWCFVSYHAFGSGIRYRDVIPKDRVERFFGTTRRGESYSVRGDRIINRGIERDVAVRRSGVQFDRFELEDRNTPRAERSRSGVIETYRPRVESGRADDSIDRGRASETRELRGNSRDTWSPPSRQSAPDQRSRERSITRPTNPTREFTPPSRSAAPRSAPAQRQAPTRSPRSNRDH